MNKAVFLDRDGTIIEHVHYLKDPSKVTIVQGGIEALRALQSDGFLLVVVSNQSLVGRGFGTVEEVEAVNARTLELFSEAGVTIDCVKYCPHHPDDACACRKPKPGMLLEASNELHIDLGRSVMIGDNMLDAEAGMNAGCGLSIQINGESKSEYSPRASNLSEAIGLIIKT